MTGVAKPVQPFVRQPLELGRIPVNRIWNTYIPDDRPEYELFDHVNDPINMTNVADQHPEVVERLATYLKNWQEAALAAKLETEAAAEEMSPEELEKLRALGYIN